MQNYKYKLEPYKGMASRYTCPACRKAKTFTRYIDRETGKHISDHVGKCSRLDHCEYHYTPKQYFEANKPLFEPIQKPAFSYTIKKSKPVQVQSATYVPLKVFKDSLQPHERNYFVSFLIALFGTEKAAQLVSRYFIGTSKHWNGATVFWQIDSTGKIRAGKIMLYDPEKGKRVKEPYNHITWMHKALKLSNYELKQCLFGEHLLKTDLNKPCALVESEKTAIIASVYLPQFHWLAVGSLTNLNAEKCQVLKGRSVTLFPDLNGFAKWKHKAKELSQLARFTVSDLLERKATEEERQKGLDLADYLARLCYKDFIKSITVNPVPVEVKDVECEPVLTEDAECEPTETEDVEFETVEAENVETINLETFDVLEMMGETHTGKEFGKMIIAGIKTKAGKIYDLLFDREGEPIQPGTQPEMVNKLATFFNKQLQPAFLNGTPCLLHIYKY